MINIQNFLYVSINSYGQDGALKYYEANILEMYNSYIFCFDPLDHEVIFLVLYCYFHLR